VPDLVSRSTPTLAVRNRADQQLPATAGGAADALQSGCLVTTMVHNGSEQRQQWQQHRQPCHLLCPMLQQVPGLGSAQPGTPLLSQLEVVGDTLARWCSARPTPWQCRLSQEQAGPTNRPRRDPGTFAVQEKPELESRASTRSDLVTAAAASSIDRQQQEAGQHLAGHCSPAAPPGACGGCGLAAAAALMRRPGPLGT